VDRKEFVKRAGVGTVGLGALVASPAALAGRPGFTKGDGHQHATFVCLSRVPAPSDHHLVMEGFVEFKAKNGKASGGGNFSHVRLPGPTPVADGKWEVTDFISYGPVIGDYGRIRSSILNVSVVLVPDAGGSFAATLRVVCNVGFVPLMTGEPEGIQVNVPAAGVNFSQPLMGLTHISIPEGESSA
jgi:hypothetical protein